MGLSTTLLDGVAVRSRLEAALPGSTDDDGVAPGLIWLRPERLVEAAAWLRDDAETDLAFLSAVTGVDRWTSFEVVYHLYSLPRNHHLVARVRIEDHDRPEVPSVVPVWYGAHLQEREVYDLMGIRFLGHPRMERVLLWEGFPGHPLRKDWLGMAGARKSGLAHFPHAKP